MKEIPNLQKKYFEEIVPKWVSEKKYSTVMAAPKLLKVIVNTGLGDIKDNKAEIDKVYEQIEQIAGQRPVITTAKKSIAGFSVREGMTVGIRVTLRGKRMYHFLEKTFNFVLPRTRDFQGLPLGGFDGNGNYSFGLDDQMIFLEIDPNKVRRRQGLQITIVTTAQTDDEARELLVELGLPLAVEKE